MSVKSYTDRNGKQKYYCSFYYTDYNGARKRKKIEGFERKKDAIAAENEFLDKLTGSCDMPFKVLAELYLKDCKARLKPTTLYTKSSMFNEILIPYFCDIKVIDISPLKIRQWQNHLLDHEPKYTDTYLKSLNNQMSAFFNFCIRYYGLKVNPTKGSSIGKSRSGRLDFYTLDDFNAFMKALKDITSNKAFITAFEILFYTGIRCGELFALTRQDFNTDDDTLIINKNYAKIKGKEYILPPKTPKSNRIVTVPSKIAKHLQEYIDTLYQPQPKERLFPTLNKPNLAKMIAKTAKKAGIKKIRVHDFRHSHASLLIELGFSPLLISERLGHEKIETTLQIYSHLYPKKAETVAQKIDSLIV